MEWPSFVGITAIAQTRIQRGFVAARVMLRATLKTPRKTPPHAPLKTLTPRAALDHDRRQPHNGLTPHPRLRQLDRCIRECDGA
jgi:hypothetical protein